MKDAFYDVHANHSQSIKNTETSSSQQNMQTAQDRIDIEAQENRLVCRINNLFPQNDVASPYDARLHSLAFALVKKTRENHFPAFIQNVGTDFINALSTVGISHFTRNAISMGVSSAIDTSKISSREGSALTGVLAVVIPTLIHLGSMYFTPTDNFNKTGHFLAIGASAAALAGGHYVHAGDERNVMSVGYTDALVKMVYSVLRAVIPLVGIKVVDNNIDSHGNALIALNALYTLLSETGMNYISNDNTDYRAFLENALIQTTGLALGNVIARYASFALDRNLGAGVLNSSPGIPRIHGRDLKNDIFKGLAGRTTLYMAGTLVANAVLPVIPFSDKEEHPELCRLQESLAGAIITTLFFLLFILINKPARQKKDNVKGVSYNQITGSHL